MTTLPREEVDMDREKKKRLENAGWQVGTTKYFLDMSDSEAHLVEMKVSLCDRLRRVRERRGWTQSQLAERMGSSQSRVAKMESGDPSVSIDLLVHALLTMGSSPREIAKAISTPSRKAAGA